jgi:hypothetical protein
MQRVPVRLAINGHRPDAHLLARADHPQRDLTPICDQNLTKHTQLNPSSSKQETRRNSDQNDKNGSEGLKSKTLKWKNVLDPLLSVLIPLITVTPLTTAP